MKLQFLCAGGLIAACVAGSVVQAGVSQEKASQLGGDKYTCMGAKKAGNDQGVAEYTGKWYKEWPGLESDTGYVPGPYADEEPKFTITADNMEKYADRLTEGQKALFKKYPDKFRMNVYPSHRDFRPADWKCEVAKYNAKNAKLVDGGLGVKGHGGAPPFPFPENGMQAIWNVINPVRAWTEEVTYDIRAVYSNGDVTKGRVHFKTMNTTNNPNEEDREPYSSEVNAYFFNEYILPPRNKGDVAVGYQPNNFANNSTQAWQYQPGIRRVKKAPEVGFDYPIPPAGLRTTDSDYIFNGSPSRYNWKLVGKKTIFAPYNNFKINDPSLSYDKLIQKHTINPEYVRYEPRRVWVIEATLKPNMRHIHQRRVIYVDEDTWLPLTGDNYDQQGKLWRVPMVLLFRSQESGTYHRGVSVYHNLTSGAYEATYLVNGSDEDQWWKINRELRKQEFSPEAAMRAGQ